MMRAANAALVLAATLLGTASAFAANPPNALDLPPAGVTPPVDMLQTAPAQQSPSERPRELSGNPLWAIPLSSLSVTRDRPLFTPSRRPPAPAAVAAPPPSARIAAPPPPAEPERPQLTLVGAVAAESGGIAIFIDQTTNDVVRLKTGDSHSGWKLRSVKGREAEFQKNSETLTLALPAPGALAPSGPPPIPAPGARPPAMPQSAPGQPLPPGWVRTPSGEIVNTE
jgi:general secretion pathway protein N